MKIRWKLVVNKGMHLAYQSSHTHPPVYWAGVNAASYRRANYPPLGAAATRMTFTVSLIAEDS